MIQKSAFAKSANGTYLVLYTSTENYFKRIKRKAYLFTFQIHEMHKIVPNFMFLKIDMLYKLFVYRMCGLKRSLLYWFILIEPGMFIIQYHY